MNHQFEIEVLEDEEIEDMRYYPPPNADILRCPNSVLIIDICTGSHKFMVFDDYYPEEHIECDGDLFRVLPNTTIEYESLVNGQTIVYHLDLNSLKLDKHKRPVKKFQIRPLNASV
jgi:hypothetical protein